APASPLLAGRRRPHLPPARGRSPPHRFLRFSPSILARPSPSVPPETPGPPPPLGITRPARHRPRGHKPTRPPMPQGLPAGGQGRLGVHRERVPAHPHIRGPTGPAQVSFRLRCRRPGQPACPPPQRLLPPGRRAQPGAAPGNPPGPPAPLAVLLSLPSPW